MKHYNMFKRAGRDFFASKPEENDRVNYCVNLFYSMFPERLYLPGQMAVELPFNETIIEQYIMKYPSIYDKIDLLRIIKACDNEYLDILRVARSSKSKD